MKEVALHSQNWPEACDIVFFLYANTIFVLTKVKGLKKTWDTWIVKKVYQAYLHKTYKQISL